VAHSDVRQNMEDHEVYAAIGRIVVAFNSVEHWLARLLASSSV